MTYCSLACAKNEESGPVVREAKGDAEAIERPVTSEAKAAAKAVTPAIVSEAEAKEDLASETKGSPSLTKPQNSRWLSGGRRRRVLWASAAIMVGGMAVAIIPVIAPTASSSVSAADSAPSTRGPMEARDTPPVAPAPAAALARAPLTKQELRAAAVAELERELREGSERNQRLAGIALSRLSHDEAQEVLVELLKTENSDLSRVDIAYGLALGGLASGRSYLVGELKSKRRDVRIDAARRLVQLGDDAGRNTLVQMLGIRSHRLGAATMLAQLGDERGLELLRETLADPESSKENKMRAAVGIGRSGDASASSHLKSILSEGQYVVDAAGALAVLGDPSVTPALLRQLELTSMRVRAAESLKRIGQEVDLAPMEAALKTGNLDGRIAAAEAILVLTSAEESK